MEYLSQHLRALRAAQGKTQKLMASLLQKDQAAYSRIERGLEKITVEDLTIIAREFGLEAHELLEIAQSPPFPQKK